MRFKKIKFEIIADEWLKYKKNSVKESTYYEYMCIIEKHLKKEYKGCNVYNLNDISGYINVLKQKYSSKTVRDIINVLCAIIKYFEDEYECHIKIKKFKLPKSNKNSLSVLSRNETKKLENYCVKNIDNKKIGILIGLNTGMRIGEICALQWKDIDLKDNKFFVTKTVERVYDCKNKKTKLIMLSPKTDTSYRSIPISYKMKKILEPLKNNYEKDAYLLSGNMKIIEPRNLQNTFKKVLYNTNIKERRFHCLRHTFATNCIEAGMDIKSLSEILGHSNVNITLNLYVHSSYNMKKKYLDRI